MRLKRDSVFVLFKVMDASTSSIIEAVFATPEAMDRYFANHDLGRKHQLGADGEIYPKLITKKFKFYSLEEVTRRKRKTAGENIIEEVEEKEKAEGKEQKKEPLDDLLADEERPDADEGDK